MAAASLPLEEFDEKFLTCPVCEDIYDDPRVLPCLHTFCAKCLEKWRREKGQLTCPTCRHQVTLQGTGVSSLPPNFFINSLLDFRALHKSEKDHTQCQMCKSDAKVEGRCSDCDFLVCKNCIKVHNSIPALKDHYIITLHELKNPGSRPKYTRAQYCPRHTDQRMTFYCQPCAKLVCRDCTITEHRPGPNHDPHEVSEVAQKYKTDLQTLVAKTLDTADDLNKAKETVGQELTSITTNCQTLRNGIQDHFAQMRAKLNEEERKITEKLDKMEMTQKEPLVKEDKDLVENIKSTEDGLKFSTDILSRDPYGLAVQRDGRVIVANPDKHSILLFETDGTLVKQVGWEEEGEGQFKRPLFVCVDKEDNIIVSDKTNDCVQVFDKNMNFHHKFGKWGKQPQDMMGPMGVSADSRGNILLANIGGTDDLKHGKKLQVFRPDGTWISTISSDGDKLNRPHGVTVTEDGHVFVADTVDHCIRKYRYM
ncbi:TRIM2 [Branchiostoma lanceolatum]|uniref:RING-type E3 ubiquitin transferase n=1 Tax=Branchiostoma lanceolatum TaxID=7740 RepID=A0A8K0ELU6_BRALA|nr:TRIM2 [Branchiostoma lanceolatum]